MKALLSIVTLLIMNFAQAADIPSEQYMSLSEQNDYMVQEAKDIRRQYWQNGYEEVSSQTTFVTKDMLDEHVKQEQQYENYLSTEEVSKLYKCYYSKSCELYLVMTTSEFYSGTGMDAHFVMLYTKSKKSFTITHTVYAE